MRSLPALRHAPSVLRALARLLLALLIALMSASPAAAQPDVPAAIEPVEFTPEQVSPAVIYGEEEGDGPGLASTHYSDTLFAVVNGGTTEIALRLCSPGPQFQLRSERPGVWMSDLFNRTAASGGCSPSPTSWWRIVIGITPSPDVRYRIYTTAYENLLGPADFMQRARRYLCSVPAQGQLSCTRETVTVPQLVIDRPAAGQLVSGAVPVCGWAVDRASGSGPGVSDVHVRVNGQWAGAAAYGAARGDVGAHLGDSRFSSSGYCLTLNTRTFANGPARLDITYRSALTGVWHGVSRGVTISNTAVADTTLPDGRITAPASQTTIGPAPLTISASAWDNAGGSGVAAVIFYASYNSSWYQVGSDATAPYALTWTPPPGLGSQQLRLAIHVVDRAGNRRADAGGQVALTYKAPAGIVVQGFDTCAAPSEATMNTWRQSSPYRVVGIYIGGSARACAQANLNSTWVRNLGARGWRFIPIWVGPQAPCTGYGSRLSYDAGVAYNQGMSEARSALTAARGLALTNPQGKSTVIYYDMENYDTRNSLCHEAVKSFISGWVRELRAQGNLAAVYGSACASGAASWATLPNVPDAVWLAHWIRTSYDPNVSVYGVACVPDGYWYDQQRIRQYTGGHRETWGGATINIDSNRVFGPVVLPDVGSVKLSAGLASAEPLPSLEQAGPAISALQLVTPALGWALVDGQLRLTEDGGASWRALTLPAEATILAAQFDAAGRGRVLATVPTDEGLAVQVLSGADRGESWETHTLYRWRPETGEAGPLAGSLTMLDGGDGWALVRLATSNNFSSARLFRASARGADWEELSAPAAGTIAFTDRLRGEIVGGPSGTARYQTADGGLTWQEAPAAPPAEAGREGATQVSFATNQHGWALVETGGCGEAQGGLACARGSAIWTTSDGGSSWEELPLNSARPYQLFLPLMMQ